VTVDISIRDAYENSSVSLYTYLSREKTAVSHYPCDTRTQLPIQLHNITRDRNAFFMTHVRPDHADLLVTTG
jgi:hypothetical protein